MKTCDLKEVTGKELKEWYKWLVHEKEGCCAVRFASTEKYRYCVCMGWHHYDDEMVEDGHGNPVTGRCGVKYRPIWKIAWKIGRQTHNNAMQCDFDIDFEMPYVTEAMAKADPKLCAGDIDDTLEIVSAGKRTTIYRETKFSAPTGYRSWEDFAKYVRKTARRVWRDWRDNDE